MLKLHSLEISGFKSFLEPVELRFADGITAIVGPNGCGKSNLTDAITWVLGEQSAKSLRGSKMEDVIFAGSDKRRPVGMAQVDLTFLADGPYPEAVDGRIHIGRQVHRSGESRYVLNGKRVRLKQIKDLLMDTGLGIRAYSVIEQGKIGMILSGKPQERRRLLEEAAGITRYKARKRVAELKLEETTANLLRLDDIVSEVERSLRSLKRQAGAARRYKKQEIEYRGLLQRVLAGRWGRLRASISELDARLEAAIEREASLAAGLEASEGSLAAGREALETLATELATRQERRAELAAQIEGRQEFLKGAAQRSREMEERLTRGRADAETRRQQSRELEQSIGSLDERAKALVEERDEAAAAVERDREVLASAEAAVKAQEARLGELRRELMTSIAALDKVRSSLQRESTEIEKLGYRSRFLADERTRLDRQLQEATSTLETIDGAITTAEASLARAEADRTRLSTELEALLARENQTSEERRRLENELAGARQRQRILVQLSKEHEEGRKSLVEALGKLGVETPRFLADQMRLADPTRATEGRAIDGWAEGLDHFLGELADAVVLAPEADALALARGLSELDVAGAFLRPVGRAGDVATPPIDDEAIFASLADALDLDPALLRALPPAYLVESAEAAARLAEAHPGVAFIDRRSLWARGGVLRVRGEEAAPGVLARESELALLSGEIPALEAQIQALREALRELVAERTRLAGEKNRADDAVGAARREIAVSTARRQDAESRREKVAGSHDTVAREQAEIAEQVAEKTKTRESLQGQLGERETDHTDKTAAFDAAQAEVEATRERREAARAEAAARRGRLELLEERLDAQSQEAVRVRRQITYTEEQLAVWAQEDEGLGERIDTLRGERESAETQLREALEARSGAEEAVREQQRRLDTRRESLRGDEQTVTRLREERDTVRAERESLRVDRAGLSQNAEHLSVTYIEAFGKHLPGLPAPAGWMPPEPDVPEPDVPQSDATEPETAEPESAEPESTEPEAAEPEAAEPEAPTTEAPTSETDPEQATLPQPEPLAEDDVEVPVLEATELAALEASLARTKATLERLGPVNALAGEEYDEQEERLGFLRTQRTDVADSVASLRETIREINEASSERFKATFEQVNAVFGETFAKLFRGGEAQMRLYDEDDILDTGIEIVARPPGKRPQNILLLSGGEKALTAVALLFALFQAKPSPFCILDEVDAPLDDANVLRFVETLAELARGTQFLVITHNKLTMEVADRLYGVTMQEKGVSKLVSAEMSQLHPRAPSTESSPTPGDPQHQGSPEEPTSPPS